jgi:hypothetical protein
MRRINRSSRIHKRRHGRRAPRTRPQAAGVAMLLVLVCLATATIATTAYVTSRDNSGVIGQNTADAAAAQWAAGSGLDTAIALLETNWDWRTLHVNGTLFSDVLIAGASVSVLVEDFLTRQPPTEHSSYLIVVARARIGSAEQTAATVVHTPSLLDEAVAVDLGDFAVFFSDSLEVRDRAILARWPKSPLTSLGSRVRIGGTATASSSVVIRGDAAAIDVTAYRPPDASATFVTQDSGPEMHEIVLPDPLPYPEPPPLIGLEDITVASPINYTLPSGTFLVAEDSHFNKMELKNNAVMTFQGDITVVLDDNLEINTGARLLIDGDVTLIVFGNLLMDNGAIELRDGARLTTFVRGADLASWSIDLRDSYIGERRLAATIDASGEASWMDPQRIRFYSIENLLADAGWRLRGNSVFKGEIYAPHAGVLRIEEISAVYGRVASSSVLVRDDSAIFYCHTLMPYNGFTNLGGELYEDGRLKDEFKLIASLDPITLETLATGTRTVIRLRGDLIGDEEELSSDTDSGSVSVGTISLGGTVARIEGSL